MAAGGERRRRLNRLEQTGWGTGLLTFPARRPPTPPPGGTSKKAGVYSCLLLFTEEPQQVSWLTGPLA